ncbi:MAG: ligase-associated DNA damage response endonuclease PdeM [Chitinophagaceae bacterium]|nr:ligase-associated DNA damage response endonuclease PdeM [Chitinophagaceae bacterium]
MFQPLLHEINGNRFWVFQQRCLLWEEEDTLIVADLHLGKVMHFRKAGIPVPHQVYKSDLQRLMAMLFFSKASRLLIIGDFTHSSLNSELELFAKWRKDFSTLHIDLVKGNHDILSEDWYSELNITLHEEELWIKEFCFRHEKRKKNIFQHRGKPHFTFCGHVHPAVVLVGPAKQRLEFPCFYFSKDFGVLPAFSKFSGKYILSHRPGETTVYAITPSEIIKVG